MKISRFAIINTLWSSSPVIIRSLLQLNNIPGIKIPMKRSIQMMCDKSLKFEDDRLLSPTLSNPTEVDSVEGFCWIDLNIPPHQLRPNLTLRMGQCFNWKRLAENCNDDDVVWIGVYDTDAYAIRQTSTSTEFVNLLNNHNSYASKSSDITKLTEYFQLKYDLNQLYDEWSSSCSRMAYISKLLPGVRVLRQDPFECLISFICSSCNNIKRISQMLDSLRSTYGKYLCTVELKSVNVLEDRNYRSRKIVDVKVKKVDVSSDKSVSSISDRDTLIEDGVSVLETHHLYAFPTVLELSKVSEAELRQMGFGYRARFIVDTVRLLNKKESVANSWLEQLRTVESLSEVQNHLMEFPGI